MQMMPKISCPQRVASGAIGRASAAPDVVAISIPLAFVVNRGIKPAWHTIYPEWDGCIVPGLILPAEALGLWVGGLSDDTLGALESRKDLVEIAAQLRREVDPHGPHPLHRLLAAPR